MKVILRDDVDHLGKLGEIVEVKDGYARNYLLPRRLALHCTPDAEKQIEAERKRRVVREAHRVEELKKVAETLNGRSVTITAKADEEKLYGSVGAPEIVAAIFAEHKLKVPESAVVLEAPFKTLGTPDVTLRLAQGAEAIVKVWIVAET
ncbi:MAG: 50S ribosomal protein L9 [Planctomycetota bacterium]|nr:50S ribosomal protein L9 [Planctomycetota bacterium]